MVEAKKVLTKEESEKLKAERVLAFLDRKPKQFLCTINGVTMGKGQLLAAVDKRDAPVLDFLDPFSTTTSDGMSHLGKRYVCLVCGTQILCVKPKGEEKEGGKIPTCCGQTLESVEPKPMPSSD